MFPYFFAKFQINVLEMPWALDAQQPDCAQKVSMPEKGSAVYT